MLIGETIYTTLHRNEMKMETNQLCSFIDFNMERKYHFQEKKIQSKMMQTVENVCLGDEEAKAYCRKLQEKKDPHARAYR